MGVCVVAGNVRRTAEIAFGDPGSEEYIDLKNYDKNPGRASFGWASNNSVLARLGMDYTKVLFCLMACLRGIDCVCWGKGEVGLAQPLDRRSHCAMILEACSWRRQTPFVDLLST